jgi:nematocidal protein AidA
MAEADVMITIDSATIVAVYGRNNDPNNPRNVDQKYIYMVTAQPNAFSGNGGGELDLKVRVNDNIRWRETSITAGSDQQILLYKFVSTDPRNELITPPFPVVTYPTVPFPDPNNPARPVPTKITDFFWQCTVRNTGRVTYHFQFMVTDRDCNVLGYYQWDPFITISG